MKIYMRPSRSEWSQIITRPAIDHQSLKTRVAEVLAAVKAGQNRAVGQFTRQFDGVNLTEFTVSEAEIEAAIQEVPASLKAAIQAAARNIEAFHQQQTSIAEPMETQPGVKCWRKSVGIEKVGLYIPGGSAPLFSTILMLGIPARIAGCKEVILCSPPDKQGKLHPAILFAAREVGIQKIFKIGGVQAIGAMAYGTETVPRVYKLFGPGNQYVTCAKQLVQEEGLAIDMPAGPSEVCVIADDTAQATFVASDLLSQAEHGPDSQALLLSTSESLVLEVQKEILAQVENLPRRSIALKALENSKLVVLSSIEEATGLANAYAPEHLIIAMDQPESVADNIINAGSVFLGHYSPESVGDYASGTNHTLPTNGFATAYSGVSVDSFVRKITFQKLSPEGLAGIATTVVAMAEAEGLQAHANAVKVRNQQL
ncbi:MAG TPA: histidinol dehydrogenase [Arachidicoccus sp.]|nr:histidinol dehydrogenase [Arachidicoccus sp.]